MNLVFISPNFPPQFFLFCERLRDVGVTVLGIGDAPYETLRPSLRRVLHDYVYVPDMTDVDAMTRACGYLTWRHGKIDRIDSLNEHWMPVEAQMRQSFDVYGLKPAHVEAARRKSEMKEIFKRHKISHAPGDLVRSGRQIERFAEEHGLPLIFKPDQGVGAGGVFKVSDARGLAAVVKNPPQRYLVEKFVAGRLMSFDGVTDKHGRILLEMVTEVSSGVMEIVTEGLPMHYYSLREPPKSVSTLGRRVVRAFDVRERFFHIELFRTDGNKLVVIEVNLRPPGGFGTDMMNYTFDIDVYELWANIVAGHSNGFELPEPKYHCAHVARRKSLAYRRSLEELRAAMGERLLMWGDMPRAFSVAMGDEFYLSRTEDLARLEADIALIEETI